MNMVGYAPVIGLQWQYLFDNPIFRLTEKIFLASKIYNHLYYFDEKLPGNNIEERAAFYQLNIGNIDLHLHNTWNLFFSKHHQTH